MKRDSEKKKPYSPYRSNSQVAAKEAALGIVNSSNASATSTSALKLRQLTSSKTTKSRPISARTSTPIVPKPGQKRPKSRSKELKPTTAKAQQLEKHSSVKPPSNAKPAMAKPPQPVKLSRRPSQGSVTLSKSSKVPRGAGKQSIADDSNMIDCGVSITTAVTHSASVPVNLQQSSSSIKSSDLASQKHRNPPSKQQK